MDSNRAQQLHETFCHSKLGSSCNTSQAALLSMSCFSGCSGKADTVPKVPILTKPKKALYQKMRVRFGIGDKWDSSPLVRKLDDKKIESHNTLIYKKMKEECFKATRIYINNNTVLQTFPNSMSTAVFGGRELAHVDSMVKELKVKENGSQNPFYYVEPGAGNAIWHPDAYGTETLDGKSGFWKFTKQFEKTRAYYLRKYDGMQSGMQSGVTEIIQNEFDIAYKKKCKKVLEDIKERQEATIRKPHKMSEKSYKSWWNIRSKQFMHLKNEAIITLTMLMLIMKQYLLVLIWDTNLKCDLSNLTTELDGKVCKFDDADQKVILEACNEYQLKNEQPDINLPKLVFKSINRYQDNHGKYTNPKPQMFNNSKPQIKQNTEIDESEEQERKHAELRIGAFRAGAKMSGAKMT